MRARVVLSSLILSFALAGPLAAAPALAGGLSSCPDYTGDGRVSLADVLYVVDSYFEPDGEGGIFGIGHILNTIDHYGESCT